MPDAKHIAAGEYITQDGWIRYSESIALLCRSLEPLRDVYA
jgi:hypothetical protein